MLISDAVTKTGLSADTLRYYEKMGLIPPVPRTDSGQRDYTDDIIEWIFFIIKFKEIGMPLESIAHYVKLAMAGSDTRAERRRLLMETRRSQVQKIKSLFDRLRLADGLLKDYDSALLPETESFAGRWRGRWACWDSCAAPQA